MLSTPIVRSPDLKRLRDEGYDIEIKVGHLLMRGIPYVTIKKEVRFGTLISTLVLAGDKAAYNNDHVVHFSGETPCEAGGQRLDKIINASNKVNLGEGLSYDHSFSSKPPEGYKDYYEKMSAYATMLECHAHNIDPNVRAKAFLVVPQTVEQSVFMYTDSASARSGTTAANLKLEIPRIGIVGLGGTGSYILDLTAKTPVGEIHVFDGDIFFQHNAFRAPGAPSLEALTEMPSKVAYYTNIYSKMRRGIIPHNYYVDATNVSELQNMNFIFICMDKGKEKKTIIEALEKFKIPFIDVGMGIGKEDNGSITGMVRTTVSIEGFRAHTSSRISYGEENDNEYGTNIQIADLNALNATLAVIKWKKIFGFYADEEGEHNSIYLIEGNKLLNDDKNK